MTPAILLLRPQMGENIGAVARAMANFGLTDLRIISPRDGWPNEKAYETASGADFILEQAEIHAQLDTALHDIQRLYATTARPRDMEKPTVTPELAIRQIRETPERSAILFGPERTGLTNDDLVLADAFLTIPTMPDFASLNLAQSVVILGHTWYSSTASQEQRSGYGASAREAMPASKQDLQGFFDHFERVLDSANYFPTLEKKPLMWQSLRNIFTRTQMSAQEVRSLRGVLTALGRAAEEMKEKGIR